MGVLARLGARLSWALMKRETVGFDSAGNKYYRQHDRTPEGDALERRLVKYASSDYDPTKLPVEWSQWLQKTRADAPDAAAIALGEESRAASAERAAGADAAAEQARRVWQEQTGAHAAGSFTQIEGSPADGSVWREKELGGGPAA
jgi:NADH:ubiquinone oxidoreductase subunit